MFRTLALATFLFASSGCLAPSSADGAETAPQWTAGDHWDYQYGQNWINWTVEARETFGGRDAYKVHTGYPASLDDNTAILWIDASTLGVIGGVYETGTRFQTDCPILRVFPYEPQEYTCTLSMAGYQWQVAFNTEPGTPRSVTVPVGSFTTMPLNVLESRMDGPGMQGDGAQSTSDVLFAPEVGNRLFQQGQDCYLGDDGVRHCTEVDYGLAAYSYAAREKKEDS